MLVPVQLGLRQAVIDRRPETVAALAAQFTRERRLLLPGLLGPDLLATIWRRLEDATFVTRVATRVHPPAIDQKLVDPVLLGSLHFLLNDAAVVEFVRRVSAQEVTGFVGAVYRLEPGGGHRDSWHNDLDGNRRAGLTVNLSRQPFAGGELQLRARGAADDVLWTVANTGPGDGLLFPIGDDVEHCIRPIEGSHPKTALAGWFCLDPDLKL